jgi:hypothetical protein
MRVATAVLVAAVAGCGGDNTGPNGQTNGDMTAKIDGASFTSVTTLAQRNTTNAGTIIAVSGADSHGLGLGFGILDAGVGTYPIGGLTPTNATVLDGTGKVWTAGAIGGSGTLTVTALDATHIAGTFAYSAVASAGTGATGTKAVTEGVFDVKF